MSETPISVRLEFTPNPNTLKFAVDRVLVERGSANFLSSDTAVDAPLVQRLFEIPGVAAVMVGGTFVTITKSDEGDWDIVAEQVPQVLERHLSAGLEVLTPAYFEKLSQPTSNGTGDVEDQIRNILDTEIRPAVAMDGGDILFGKYEDGVVYLHLQGACSSCPSSIATLKMGVESRLKEAIPEVREVVQM